LVIQAGRGVSTLETSEEAFPGYHQKGAMCTRFALATALVLTASLGACGGGSSGGPSNPTSPTSPIASTPTPLPTTIGSGDNWSLSTDDFSNTGRRAVLTALEGSFDVSGAAITAVFAPSGTCFNSDSDRVRFTGTRSGRAVQLESQALNGQVLQLRGTLSSAGDGFEGTVSIAGGCANGAAARMTGLRVNWSGIWTGRMGTIPTVFDLQMASVPDADGNFGVSGSAKFSNTQCFANAVVTRRGRGRTIFPDVVGENQRLELIASVYADLSAMYISYALVTGVCPELNFGEGTLVRQ
jgi:hypothetical protein